MAVTTGIARRVLHRLFPKRAQVAPPEQPPLPADFSAQAYRYMNPDLMMAQVDPAQHYREYGAQEGRAYLPDQASHPLFDEAYYARKYKRFIREEHPFIHFIRNGHRGFNPSPRFDAKRYAQENHCRTNPLEHYVLNGIRNGIVPRRAEPVSREENVESAFLRLIKESPIGRRNVLFVTYSADGRIKPHVPGYVQALHGTGRQVFLIVTSELSDVAVPESLSDACSSIAVRQNMGYDFAAWAHILRRYPALEESDQIVIANDSLIGPLGDAFGPMMSALDRNAADVVGLTENPDYSGHIQSFFIAFNRNALRASAFHDFWGGVVNLRDKSSVIFDYEITLANRMRAGGLTTSTVFENISGRNDPIFNWSALIDRGFPFIKAEIIKTADPETLQTIRSKLQSLSFDVSLAPR